MALFFLQQDIVVTVYQSKLTFTAICLALKLFTCYFILSEEVIILLD